MSIRKNSKTKKKCSCGKCKNCNPVKLKKYDSGTPGVKRAVNAVIGAAKKESPNAKLEYENEMRRVSHTFGHSPEEEAAIRRQMAEENRLSIEGDRRRKAKLEKKQAKYEQELYDKGQGERYENEQATKKAALLKKQKDEGEENTSIATRRKRLSENNSPEEMQELEKMGLFSTKSERQAKNAEDRKKWNQIKRETPPLSPEEQAAEDKRDAEFLAKYKNAPKQRKGNKKVSNKKIEKSNKKKTIKKMEKKKTTKKVSNKKEAAKKRKRYDEGTSEVSMSMDKDKLNKKIKNGVTGNQINMLPKKKQEPVNNKGFFASPGRGMNFGKAKKGVRSVKAAPKKKVIAKIKPVKPVAKIKQLKNKSKVSIKIIIKKKRK